MFKEKVNARTDGHTDGRTHNGHRAMTYARWPTASGAKNANFHLKMATFPLLIVSFFKINRIQAVDNIDKLCKLYKNMTINEHCMA